MNSEAITRKYYSKLKSLPDIKILSTVTALESVIIVLRSFELGLVYLYSFAVYIALLVTIFIKDKKLILFFSDITGLFYLILPFITTYYYYSLTFFSPLIGYTLLPKYSESRAAFIVFISNIIPTIFFFDPYIVIYSFLIAFIFYYYIHTVNKKGEKITGIKSMQILRPFLSNVVKKDKTSLEKFLESISFKTTVHVGLFKVDDLFFVIPKIHYGISGEIGSSKFIYQLESENNHNIVFHGPGSHEIDIATSSQSMITAKRIAEKEKSTEDWLKLNFYGIKEWSCGEFRGITLDFGSKTLTFLERPNYGIDDLPLKLWDFTVKTNNYIIDCHNEYLTKDLPLNSYSCIINGITKARNEKGNERPFILGYAEDIVNNCEGLCNNRLRVMYISDGEKDIGLIYIYSNNSDPELTKKIRQRLGTLVKYPILVTPDDHSCTGTIAGDLYTPAQPCDTLVGKAYELLKKAKEKAHESEVYFKKDDIKGVRVLGSFISLMVKALEEVGGYAMKTFWIPLLTPFILTILFILLLTNIHIEF